MDALTCVPLLSRPTRHTRPVRPGWDAPRLSVVIVNYQRWEDTSRLVRQLRNSRAVRMGLAEIVIVDNHSPPHPVIGHFRRSADVSLRRWGRNRGFARAVNEGCRLARGEWFLLLNPDTSVPPRFLDQVLAQLNGYDARAGIVGYRLKNPDGSVQLSTGRDPGLFRTLTRLLLPRHARKYDLPAAAGPCRVDWVTGCCLLIRRACFTELGGLDTDFFLYYEDVDLCRRARQRGWSVWFDPTAAIVHHRPLHSRPVAPYLRLVTRHALLTYARKHWAGWQLALLGRIVRLEAATRRLLARHRQDADACRVFAELDRLTTDLVAGRTDEARSNLLQVVRHEEQHRVAAPVDRHPHAPAHRSAVLLPVQRHPLPAFGHTGAGR
ncbi:MAG: glycosyltransferase family 2 protein [Gemmataceae bacterium]